ncbi:perlucin-like protein [Mizuhopecten yessoensis]|uniref:Perlucin-like protein n=1 Tax=Mizuhopecten yessoensis TaxID=6573 RepID=A0A210PJC0_MIZYE|nr:perlucin-like protein [Mizuhopecten yessoensis]OWF36592.1 Perlucin-like protein [Mizuhopecten yessoensis]
MSVSDLLETTAIRLCILSAKCTGLDTFVTLNNLTMIAFLLLVAIGYVNAAQGDCKHGWESFGDSCYLFAHTKLSWAEASASCQAHHSHLATVLNGAEQTFLKSHLNEKHRIDYGLHNYWIDGTDMEVEHEWEWALFGQPINYTDWMHGKPTGRLNEDCLILWGLSHYQMSDYFCQIRANFVCQHSYQLTVTNSTDGGWPVIGR